MCVRGLGYLVFWVFGFMVFWVFGDWIVVSITGELGLWNRTQLFGMGTHVLWDWVKGGFGERGIG